LIATTSGKLNEYFELFYAFNLMLRTDVDHFFRYILIQNVENIQFSFSRRQLPHHACHGMKSSCWPIEFWKSTFGKFLDNIHSPCPSDFTSFRSTPQNLQYLPAFQHFVAFAVHCILFALYITNSLMYNWFCFEKWKKKY